MVLSLGMLFNTLTIRTRMMLFEQRVWLNNLATFNERRRCMKLTTPQTTSKNT